MGQELSGVSSKPITTVPANGNQGGGDAAIGNPAKSIATTITTDRTDHIPVVPTTDNKDPNINGTDPEKPDLTGDGNHEIEFAKRFDQLTRQEKALRLKEEKLKLDSEKYEPLQRQIEELKTNPLKALKDAGWTFKELAELILNDEKPTVDKRLDDLQNKFDADIKSRMDREEREKQEAKERKEAEEKATFEKQVGQIKQAIEDLVNENEEEYELIKNQNAFDLVWDVIQEVFNQTDGKKMLTIQEAAKSVEDYLYNEAEKNLSAKKFQSRFKRIEEPSEDDQEFAKKVEDMRAPNHYMKKLLEEKYGRGLSNDMQAEGSGGKKESSIYLTDDESKALLAEKLRRRLQAQ